MNDDPRKTVQRAPDLNAFVLRVAPGRQDMLGDCLANDRVVIGWEGIAGLLDPSMEWTAFRAAVSEAYYADAPTMHKAGSAAGHLWRFIRDMEIGDYIVVPASDRQFYVGRITGPAIEGTSEDVGYWRAVEWLNDKHSIDRQLASAALQSRMKIQGSTCSAHDLVAVIESVVQDGQDIRDGKEMPTFERDLRKELLATTMEQLRFGRVDPFKFERIVQVVLDSLGAVDSSITSRALDLGDDIVATVVPLGLFELRLVAQVKHYNQLDRPLGPGVVDELLRGMEKQGADLGVIITVGDISEVTEAKVQELNDTGHRIALITGERLAELYLDHCVAGGQ